MAEDSGRGRFLNVDLDLGWDQDRDSLLAALGDDVIVLNRFGAADGIALRFGIHDLSSG